MPLPPGSLPWLPLALKMEDLVHPSPEVSHELWKLWRIGFTQEQLEHGIYKAKFRANMRSMFLSPLVVIGYPKDDNSKSAWSVQLNRYTRTLSLLRWSHCMETDAIVRKTIPSHAPGDHPEGIEAAVQGTVNFKEADNAAFRRGDQAAAMANYVTGVARLYPYSSDPTMMTFDQARAIGLCQVEMALVCNIARAVLKIRADPNESNTLTNLAVLERRLVYFHPFVTWGERRKAVALAQLLLNKLDSTWPGETFFKDDQISMQMEVASGPPDHVPVFA